MNDHYSMVVAFYHVMTTPSLCPRGDSSQCHPSPSRSILEVYSPALRTLSLCPRGTSLGPPVPTQGQPGSAGRHGEAPVNEEMVISGFYPCHINTQLYKM